MKKKKTLKIIAAVLIVAAVGLVGFGVYYMNTSKYIVEKSITSSLDKLSAIVKGEDNTFAPDSGLPSGITKFGIDSSNELTVKSGDQTVAGNADLKFYGDFDAKKLYVDLASTLNKESLLNMDMLVDNDTVYLGMDKILANKYYQKMEDFEWPKTVDAEKYLDSAIKYAKESILENLDSDKYEKTNETLKLNNAEYKTKKISVKITEEDVAKMVKTFLEKVKDDKDLVKFLKDNFNEDIETTLKESIDDMGSEIKEASKDNYFTYIIYVKGGKTIRHLFSFDGGKFAIDSYKNSNKKNAFAMTLTEVTDDKEQDVLTYLAEKTDKGKYDYKLTIPNAATISGKYTKTSDKVTIDGSINVATQDVATFNYEVSTVKKNASYNINLTVDVNVDDGNIKIVSKNKVEKDKALPNYDTSKALSIDKITPEDAQALQKYMETIENMFGSTLSSDDQFLDDSSI